LPGIESCGWSLGLEALEEVGSAEDSAKGKFYA